MKKRPPELTLSEALKHGGSVHGDLDEFCRDPWRALRNDFALAVLGVLVWLLIFAAFKYVLPLTLHPHIAVPNFHR